MISNFFANFIFPFKKWLQNLGFPSWFSNLVLFKFFSRLWFRIVSHSAVYKTIMHKNQQLKSENDGLHTKIEDMEKEIQILKGTNCILQNQLRTAQDKIRTLEENQTFGSLKTSNTIITTAPPPPPPPGAPPKISELKFGVQPCTISGFIPGQLFKNKKKKPVLKKKKGFVVTQAELDSILKKLKKPKTPQERDLPKGIPGTPRPNFRLALKSRSKNSGIGAKSLLAENQPNKYCLVSSATLLQRSRLKKSSIARSPGGTPIRDSPKLNMRKNPLQPKNKGKSLSRAQRRTARMQRRSTLRIYN